MWSLSAVPVFSVDNEIPYLSAFTNSVMVEINRLDAIAANKVKGDFISSISHEFRSPLHGILASAEFLRDTTLDNSQLELISTIQICGNTLLVRNYLSLRGCRSRLAGHDQSCSNPKQNKHFRKVREESR